LKQGLIFNRYSLLKEEINMKKVQRATLAAESVYKAGKEHYHFNMACLEFGEEAVLSEMTQEIRDSQTCSFEDAALRAATEFRNIKRLESGENRFKNIRTKCAKETKRPPEELPLIKA